MDKGKCTCGAATEGKWADIHTNGCPALGEYRESSAMIDAAWERHKAAVEIPFRPAATPNWPPRISAVGLPDGERRRGSTGQLFEANNGQWVRVNPTAEQIKKALDIQDDGGFEEYGDVDP